MALYRIERAGGQSRTSEVECDDVEHEGGWANFFQSRDDMEDSVTVLLIPLEGLASITRVRD